jgi:hypothetical protein
VFVAAIVIVPSRNHNLLGIQMKTCTYLNRGAEDASADGVGATAAT